MIISCHGLAHFSGCYQTLYSPGVVPSYKPRANDTMRGRRYLGRRHRSTAMPQHRLKRYQAACMWSSTTCSWNASATVYIRTGDADRRCDYSYRMEDGRTAVIHHSVELLKIRMRCARVGFANAQFRAQQRRTFQRNRKTTVSKISNCHALEGWPGTVAISVLPGILAWLKKAPTDQTIDWNQIQRASGLGCESHGANERPLHGSLLELLSWVVEYYNHWLTAKSKCGNAMAYQSATQMRDVTRCWRSVRTETFRSRSAAAVRRWKMSRPAVFHGILRLDITCVCEDHH